MWPMLRKGCTPFLYCALALNPGPNEFMMVFL